MSALYARSPVLAGNLDLLARQGACRNARGRRPLTADRSLQVLVADLVAARAAAGMTQEGVAVRMGTTKSVVARLESGVCTRPTLSTIGQRAVAVGALVEIRARTRR
jgi:DNA-binding XRE family transcriptional regulator